MTKKGQENAEDFRRKYRERPGLQGHRSKLSFQREATYYVEIEKKKNAQAAAKIGLWQKLLKLERCRVKKKDEQRKTDYC